MHWSQLVRRYFCMSTNLSKGQPNVHTTGLLWRLIRASMTIVGMVPPVYEDGDLLVDGGYALLSHVACALTHSLHACSSMTHAVWDTQSG